MHYCVHVRLTLGEEGGDQPPPLHAWSGLLIADMFQEGLKQQITEAVLLTPGRQSYSLDDNHTRKDSLGECQ